MFTYLFTSYIHNKVQCGAFTSYLPHSRWIVHSALYGIYYNLVKSGIYYGTGV